MIRVLVVDDSAVVRRLVRTALMLDPELEVVGTAVNGREAIDLVEQLAPDAVTLDIEMPVLDGLGALEVIRGRHARLPIVMFSTLTEKGATRTLEALSLGASDFVTKPSNTTNMAESMTSVREQLIPKIKALAGVRQVVVSSPPRVRVQPPAARPDVLLVGCSTGGPDALSKVFENLPPTLPVPVLVVQHMPPVFTAMLAARLDRVGPLSVREAQDGDVATPGEVLVAPGGRHLLLKRSAGLVRVVLDDGPPENFCRPAVDTTFRSAAETYGGKAVALVLTGMGQDGLVGCRLLADLGARILVQNEETSVVWGMPGAVAAAGLANEVLPLDAIAGKVAAAVAPA